MKLGKFKIVDGPNLYWIMITFIFIGLSIEHTWWIFAGWIVFNIVMIPISLWFHKWNEKAQYKHEAYMDLHYPGWRYMKRYRK